MREEKRRKRIRRAAAVALLLLGAVGLAGCGRTGVEEDALQTETEAETKTAEPAENTVTESVQEESAPAESPQAENPQTENGEAEAETETAAVAETDRSAVFELFSHMTVGWNLGNTFDSHGAGNSLGAETYWGNPVTTKEMIDMVAAQGINTLRIPVTWAEHVGAAPAYSIDKAWLDRVEEVVGYGLDNGMYVILDTHHEPDFWMKLDEGSFDATKAELTAIWTQVAERFRDYDEHLIFEGMNEPRTKGSPGEWSGGTGPERAAVNELNGAFLDAVRAVGGGNETRCLIICPYGNSVTRDTLQTLKLYDDPNLAVSVHLYTPYFFTYDAEGGYAQWDGSKKSEIVSNVDLVDTFLLQKGVPVIVTEFGAVNKNNTQDEIRWLQDYLGVMQEKGIKCIWWDNGQFVGNGENFALLDRRNLKWFSQEVADALVEAAGGR